MTKLSLLATFAALISTGPAIAGDPAAGEAGFGKCKACHSITAPDGSEIVSGGRIGPNLNGVIGRPVAALGDFGYGASILSVGDTGAIWDEASLAAYIAGPSEWLQATLGDPAAKSKMSYSASEGAADIAAYLASIR